MNIREYYKKTSHSNFLASWLSLVLAILFFVFHLAGLLPGGVLWVTVPFILVSMAQFGSHYFYERKLKRFLVVEMPTDLNLLNSEHVLMAFLPAPTLRLLLFSEQGALLGEIRDRNMKWYMWMIPNMVTMILPKSYELVDSSGELLARFQIKAGFSKEMRILRPGGTCVGVYREKKTLKEIKGQVISNEGNKRLRIEAQTAVHSLDAWTADGKIAASYRVGWMPLEWGNRFMANTPVLTLSAKNGVDVKIAALGVCASFLHHHSN